MQLDASTTGLSPFSILMILALRRLALYAAFSLQTVLHKGGGQRLMAQGDFTATAALQDRLIKVSNALILLYRTIQTSDWVYCKLMTAADP